MKFMVF